MNIKSIALASVAVLFSVMSAQAAQKPHVKAINKPLTSETSCPALGANYFMLPGSETCMNVSGYIYGDVLAGRDVYKSADFARTPEMNGRFALRFKTATSTQYGDLTSDAELRADWGNGGTTPIVSIRHAFLALNGAQIGLQGTLFDRWTNDFGAVLSDDILSPNSGMKTAAINYTKTWQNGLSAVGGIERVSRTGATLNNDTDETVAFLAGIKYDNAKLGTFTAIGAYARPSLKKSDGTDSPVKHDQILAAKLRYDKNLNNLVSVWGMVGIKSADYSYTDDQNKTSTTYNGVYGDWVGRYAGWLGATVHATNKADINVQLSANTGKNYAVAVATPVTLTSSLKVTPEIAYSYKTDRNAKTAVQYQIKIRHDF